MYIDKVNKADLEKHNFIYYTKPERDAGKNKDGRPDYTGYTLNERRVFLLFSKARGKAFAMHASRFAYGEGLDYLRARMKGALYSNFTVEDKGDTVTILIKENEK